MAPSNAKNNVLLTALRHPVRREILREMKELPETTPRQIAVELDEPLSAVGYHCRVLRDCGAIRLVRQESVRGALQNFYRFDVDDGWALDLLEADRDGADDSAG
ncbi:MAG: helix-turn-helix transcriptional regulator [Actinobacteria bacterium]|nr:helix-turn-helix transcriptional regulator [Actinomycetota bacterium]